MNIPQHLKDKLNTLPGDTGVYIMKNASGKVIYVGKAKNICNRVRSYFQSSRAFDPKTEIMVSKIADFEVLVTDSEMEALILEANLIKEHRPRYNVDLKDDKRFPYIKITMQDQFPRVEITRVLEKDGSKYFGPYTDAKRMRSTVDFLHGLFPLRTCSQFPAKDSDKKPCLNYQIGRCLGTCIGKATREDYMKMIDYVIKFLSGKKRELLSELREQMQVCSHDLNFEAAARCRDQIQAMERVIQKQKVVSTDGIDRDYIGSAEVGNDGCFSVMQVRDGVLMGRQHFYYSTGSDNKVEFLKNFIINYYRNTAVFPREILIACEVADRGLLEEKLGEDAGHKVEIVKPQRGKRVGLLNLAESNANLLLDQLLTQKAQTKSKLPHYLYD
ncbi:MAG: excinuclease ABC subunit C, partial [candidate division Zixibacteria bacterium]|nr:excinuclease ABC subunit C [candidate division Zixibacteria bacterium]